MDDNAQDEYTPGWLSDKIIDDYIRTLLTDTEDYYQPLPGDKFKLSVDEIKRAKHGVKDLDSCRSLIECEIFREINGQLDPSGVFTTGQKYIQVKMLGLPGKYYIDIKKLKRLLSECVVNTRNRPCRGGILVMAVMRIDRQRLIDNCTVVK